MKNKKLYIIFILLLVLLFSSLHYSFYRGDIFKNETSNDIVSHEKEKTIEEEKPVEDRKSTATILAAGDVMFHAPQIKGAYDSNTNTYDFKDNFKYVKKYVEAADLALVNFETVTAGEDVGFKGYPNFNSPMESLEALSYTGFDILSTANNHALDQGKKGLLSTIENIEAAGLKNIGTYREKNEPLLIEKVNDINIGLLSYTYGCNGMEYTLTQEELGYMINIIDEDKIKNDIYKLKEMGSDIVVVFIHWGNEYQMEPSEEQMELGRKMVEWGANIIFGSHPHVIQKTEIVEYGGKDNFIIYSLGNFLSNQRRETIKNKYTEDGIMINIEVEKDFAKGETTIKNITYIPTWVKKYSSNGKAKYEIIPIDEFIDKETNQEILAKIKESYENTMKKVSQQ
ncbi:MAG: PGA-cap domain-containing protein [Sporanaerobacter sp.]|uniref:CapA family protein n=1 Tax=Sporanaerobacter sp. TaxID=2010183 RepID=UPI003A0FD912